MKKYKAKLLIFTLLFSLMFTFGVRAEKIQEDVRVQNAYNMLLALGMPENDIGFDEEMTRSDFVVMLMSTLGFDVSENTKIKQIFLDVKSGHKAATAIYYADAMKFISGVDEEHFYPDRKISFEEAVKTIITVMGYADLAQFKGGYPGGYVAIADSADILTNSRGNDCANLYRIWANALTEPLHEINGVSVDGLANYEKTNKTLLYKYRNISLGEGIYYGNEFTTLYGSGELAEGCVEIEDEIYKDNYGIDNKLLGQNLIYLFNEDELIFAYPESTKRETVLIGARDIVSYKDGKLTYTENDRERTIRIEGKPYVFYNGVGYSGYTDADFCPVNGSLELIDETGDGKYELVFIKTAEIMIVESVTKDGLKIARKYTGGVLDLSVDGIKYSLTVDGKETKISSLAADTVLSVYASRDGKVFEIIGNTTFAYGKIDGIRYDENNESRAYATIGEEEYEIWQEASDKVYPGANGKWFLSYDGIIAEYEGFSEYRFGYLCRKFHQDDLENYYQLQIVTNTGKTVRYDLKKNVMYNLNDKMSAEDLYNTISSPQLVMFKTNSNWEITALQTVTNNLSGQYEYDENVLTLDEEISSAVFYKRMFKDILLAKDTQIFCCPDVVPGAWADPEDVTIINPSDLQNGETYNNIKIYSYNDMHEAGAVLMRSVEKNYVNIESHVLLIDKVVKTLNSDDITTYKISGYRQGKYVSYMMADYAKATATDTTVKVEQHKDGSEMKRGDIIQIELVDDAISAWRTVYRTELGEMHGEYYNTAGAYRDFRAFECQMGDFYKANENTFLMSVNDDIKRYYIDGACYVYRYSGEDVKIEEISMAELGSTGRKSAIFCIFNRRAPKVIIEYIYN